MTKRRVILRREEPPPSPPSMDSASNTVRVHVRYGECQRNHAANIGGYAVDGCREFMAVSEEEDTEAIDRILGSATGAFAQVHHQIKATKS
uniref:Mini zinc finger protein 2-like n=1 Tax=Tanacetum cinerariifolium TaxID=118510 RepID=A0A6L2NYJ1_TANCI|nr:mini zinc finger protein 2-like [Tanacetum cinerariifolium]